jgi:hypothetical protein
MATEPTKGFSKDEEVDLDALEKKAQVTPVPEHDGETEYAHPAQRKKVRILPSFPTLILIIAVSVATALVTFMILRFTSPSLDGKMQEILSNQENTSVKVNGLEQTVAKMAEDVKALQDKSQAAPAEAVSKKNRRAPLTGR